MILSAAGALMPGRLSSCALLAWFTSRGLSRLQPSRTPDATALASLLSAAVWQTGGPAQPRSPDSAPNTKEFRTG
jgi:hypothetical protein